MGKNVNSLKIFTLQMSINISRENVESFIKDKIIMTFTAKTKHKSLLCNRF